MHLDNFHGAYAAVNYLIELGHRKIGLLSGGPKWSSGIYRERGYLAALKKYGIPCDPQLQYNGAFTNLGGQMGAKVLIDRDPNLTAIFAASDEMAMGAVKAISELGLAVPEDISVIGFDGHDIGRNAPVPLTTVEADPLSVGATACEMLIGMLESNSSEVAKVVIDVKLCVRGTTGPPKFQLESEKGGRVS